MLWGHFLTEQQVDIRAEVIREMVSENSCSGRPLGWRTSYLSLGLQTLMAYLLLGLVQPLRLVGGLSLDPSPRALSGWLSVGESHAT